MGAISYLLANVGAFALVGLLFAAVAWETSHLYEWTVTLWEQYGNGTLGSYLRCHAYEYVTWFFGTDFGWTLGE